jgi:hypothetical protein
MHTKFLLENLKGRKYLEDVSIDGKTISELILVKYVEKIGLHKRWGIL